MFLSASVVLCVSICDWCHCGAAIIIQMGTISEYWTSEGTE